MILCWLCWWSWRSIITSDEPICITFFHELHLRGNKKSQAFSPYLGPFSWCLAKGALAIDSTTTTNDCKWNNVDAVGGKVDYSHLGVSKVYVGPHCLLPLDDGITKFHSIQYPIIIEPCWISQTWLSVWCTCPLPQVVVIVIYCTSQHTTSVN